MIDDQIEIINKLGLHARAAAKLASTCNHFACDIRAAHDDRWVDAKSVMSLMLLAAGRGTTLQFRFDGRDEVRAHQEVSTLIADRFGEDQ